MKKSILSLIALFVFQLILAQAPNKMSYQAVVRDSDNNLVSNQAVGLKVSILAGAVDGSVVYEETHNTNSNINGLVSVVIGEGSNQSGNFATVSWAASSHFIKTEIDPTGGTNYTITGTQQLLSVPYAMHANTADNLGGVEGTEVGEMLYWDGNNWVTIPNGEDQDVLINCDGIPTWGFCRPELTTAVNGFISATTASIRGHITYEPGITFISRGICYSTNPNPTTADTTRPANTLSFGTWTAGLAELSPNTTYYAKSYGIFNTSIGSQTYYGNEISFTTSATLGPGDYYPEEGGVIFYVLQPGDPGYDANELHGLIVSTESPSPFFRSFGCEGTLIGTSENVLSGQNNTTLILTSCSSSQAATTCNNFESMGFNDWYLPSKDELIELFQKKANVNATLLTIEPYDILDPTSHASSSEINADEYYVVYTSGYISIYNYDKSQSSKVRPIRTF